MSTETPQGYKCLTGISPAEDHIGPFFYRREETGLVMGFTAREHNCNGISTVHGGVLMAFADYTATMVALSGVKENCATISFNSDFVGAARLGDWVVGRCEITRRTGSMTFISGQLTVGEDIVLTFQTVLRRLKKA